VTRRRSPWRGQTVSGAAREYSLAAPLSVEGQSRRSRSGRRLVPVEPVSIRCPLLHPAVTSANCPCGDSHFAKGGCETTLANTKGARIRHELDRESEDDKRLYALRTMVERINSQAEALGILHPKLRRGQAIINRNTLTYVRINLRALARRRAAAEEQRPTQS
jgi:hypothetical protein